MGYSMCDAESVEPAHGVFRPIRKELGATAFGINQLDFPPNADRYPNHDHAEDGQQEVYYVLSGSGRLEIEGEDVELKPGRYVLVDPETKRKVWAGEEGLSIIVVGSPPGAYQPRQG
jgi:quercetin dioxygenase-like cupin family protein